MKQNNLIVKDKKLSKVVFSHVGWEKNLVDIEHRQVLLDKEGYEVESNIDDANVVEENICFANEYDLYGETIKIS